MRRLLLLTLLFVFSFSMIAVQPATAQTANHATVVNANYLNVRTAATTNAAVIAVIPRGYSYPVIGRTSDSAWVLLSLNNSVTGWASSSYLTIPNIAAVPIGTSSAPLPATISLGTVITGNLNVRVTPDPYNGAILTSINGGQVFTMIGRNNIGTRWWQLQLPGGGTGWVNGRYMVVANEQFVPVTDFNTNPNPQPITAYGTVTAYFLNVRTSPNPYLANIITIISRFQTYTVIGRTADSSWWQIALGNGLTGWVRGTYFSVTNSQNLPVTG